MKYQKEAYLTLISSKNKPVFGAIGYPLKISYPDEPMMNQSFIFESSLFGDAHTSDVKRIMWHNENGSIIIETRNSMYRIQPIVE